MKIPGPGSLFLLLLAALLWLTLAPTRKDAPLLINGAGASFPYPLYTRWFAAYERLDPTVRFNYQAIGSGGGQQQLVHQTVDFGASDSPMRTSLLARAPGKILHIPMIAGADVLAYHLPGSPPLRLTPAIIAEIFLGRIRNWNDSRLARINPGIPLPSLPLVVVHRSDGSGTTYIFTDYLTKVSPEWARIAGRGTAVHWPAGIGAKGNEGVAGQIRSLPGAIGYLELAYAVQNNIPYAAVENLAGNFILPSPESVTQALASSMPDPHDFRLSIANAAGPGSYPIAGLTWLLLYENPPDRRKAQKLLSFVRWCLTEGQALASSFDYAPLPPRLREQVLASLPEIR
ncbi:Phosphate-binding protein PstS [Methylacidimicrobium sp. AP8]|uniref:phosphate ABC transporter substrate-binding protein PstS n=1 Tax=Methylacidimicrobium sp. AP8 TaxID=2730359 RepID=UPI0018C11CCF|nr:phosphate ABC transporter substrate-binding protein PstS [Methylacidimicrobium sp. AP8]CAB4242662.1 Phosphate-binding protein PstS [Methylacidimicrobium sp. AP8]